MRNQVELYRGAPPEFPLINGNYNRRFMYCPRTGELILGGNDVAQSSHAHEHGLSGAEAPYDDFVRGWVGFGGGYRYGVLHFAPPFRLEDVEDIAVFDRLYDTLLAFAANGASPKMVLRGAATDPNEVRWGDAYPDMFVTETEAKSEKLTRGRAR